LLDKGYTKVAALKGGQNAWEAAKYPTEVVPQK
jgi:rhodanese-related sulfurtransferase